MCQDWKRTVRAWLGGFLFACTLYLFFTLADNIASIVADVYTLVAPRALETFGSIINVSRNFIAKTSL